MQALNWISVMLTQSLFVHLTNVCRPSRLHARPTAGGPSAHHDGFEGPTSRESACAGICCVRAPSSRCRGHASLSASVGVIRVARMVGMRLAEMPTCETTTTAGSAPMSPSIPSVTRVPQIL